jgi:hypothetical protein
MKYKRKTNLQRKGWEIAIFINGNNIFKTDYNPSNVSIPVMVKWHFGSKRE